MTTQTAQTATKEVARARLIQYLPTHLQIRVVVGAEHEWKPADPGQDIFEAHVIRSSSGLGAEAYLIVIDSQWPVKPDDPSTWQSLEGKIIEACYSPKGVQYFVPKYWATNSQPVEGRRVGIPASILVAGGINRQGAFNVSSLNLERSLSPTDLAYVRANCSR